MSSTRCPGKVLREAGGKPLLGWLLDGVAEAPELSGAIVVATSAHGSDDPIAAYCRQRKTKFFRGPLEDVTLRLLKASRGVPAFVRLCADSPLIDPRSVAEAVRHFGGCDLVTNVPAGGNSVEVIRRSALLGAYPHMSAEEREHVTLYMYRHEEEFRIKRFHSEPGILVDTEEDWEKFSEMTEWKLEDGRTIKFVKTSSEKSWEGSSVFWLDGHWWRDVDGKLVEVEFED